MNSFNRLLSLYIDLYKNKYYMIIKEKRSNFAFKKKMRIFVV